MQDQSTELPTKTPEPESSWPWAHGVRVNDAEDRFEKLARSNGWGVTKRGWPDFMCTLPDGELIAVEVKPRVKSKTRMKQLASDQVTCMDFLTAHGIRCFVSDGVTLEPYEPTVHRRKPVNR